RSASVPRNRPNRGDECTVPVRACRRAPREPPKSNASGECNAAAHCVSPRAKDVPKANFTGFCVDAAHARESAFLSVMIALSWHDSEWEVVGQAEAGSEDHRVSTLRRYVEVATWRSVRDCSRTHAATPAGRRMLSRVPRRPLTEQRLHDVV